MVKLSINPMTNKIFIDEWVAKAKEDELTAELLINENGPNSQACFHAHQMTEKLLKALMLYCDIEIEKVHDLIKIARSLEKCILDIKNLSDELEQLNHFYFETRYPGDYPEFTYDEAKEALESARNIKDYVLDKIEKKI